ncbi:MAG: hypothetical protein KME45_06755 [Stenomitos rutilans HA7619-LM2]|jgi:hypothetical protein|nr:hypothetical protein [Stenomitos rutilans HA7619-LM2]
MAKKQGSSVLLTLLGLAGGFIAGPILVLSMMSSASRSGHPVGYEGIFYLMVSPFAGAVAGGVLSNLLQKGRDFEDLE